MQGNGRKLKSQMEREVKGIHVKKGVDYWEEGVKVRDGGEVVGVKASGRCDREIEWQ